ncbi:MULTISPECIES: pyridoxamine 5'-phosphate oxidase family protein [Cyanophyceae]|uniref:pyridoxamine 5'-phosphate oxidase family protein n=1 Tax=Cyanophyceae TaxID=3028117 RepID=UPI001683268D|nr:MULTISPECIES: pyridoxamine 5'-phosphate oxidase family protein [Cyanophyceae]MBD1919264.1 pyridoxamine 5'-phosphate oxidase family protein [Phormidium sp. FACHB-77]MBD2032983.1 pyridoxamine 5'-phosphate oxidase family protein [Phormidium sp. FACHB-322]MBD2054170.1 pyridoxamine 5'-phosphate oxidase family protein [Leptolyngbya sp. FACHB-60]
MSIATAENGWVNTADGQTPEVITRARQILESTIYGALSTSSADGMPWVSPLFFTYDSDWNLYWSSAMVAQHSQNLYANQGRAAIAIYSTDREEGQGQGLYLSGTAAEVETEDVEQVISLLLKRAAKGQQRSPADYLAPSPRRLYRFQPQAVWITGERLALSETILIDTKIQLDLASLLAVT